jgi:uncharacterized protein (TIGR00369 family)
MSDQKSSISSAELEAVQQRVEQQPFTRLLQAKVTAIGPNSCELKVSIREELLQQHGFLHGGVISYAADNALTIAAAIAMKAPVVTSEFKINYLRPGQGDFIVARASCVHAGRSQGVSRCDIFIVRDGVEKLCAVAQGTISLLAKPKA